jgi:two-component system NarL family response regulator
LEIRSAPGQGTCVLVYIPHLAPSPSPEAKTPDDLVGLRLLLVDDHPLFLEGLRNMLSARGFAVVGVAHDGQTALEQARALRPDVVVMDVHMPGGGGLQATRAIKAEMPESKVVMLTVAEDDANLFEAIKSGASGYLLKSLDANRFCTLLSSVLRGDMPLAPGMAARIMTELSHRESAEGDDQDRSPLNDLTSHQQEILRFVAQGMTYKEVAEQMHLSEQTIKYHMAQIVEKLHVENRAQAIAHFYRTSQEQE